MGGATKEGAETAYETVIGLEVHVQLRTASKVFTPDATPFGAPPNSQVSYISLAHPGTLPVLNRMAVVYAVRIGLATHCQIERTNRFARKHYHYPDLPKGYQLTQSDTPIAYNGFLEVATADTMRHVQIERIHIEEDAGKSLHELDDQHSYIDLNRAGVPLIEMVTRPDLRSAEEAAAFLSSIRRLVQFLGISEGDMENGSLRCDANVSVRPLGSTTLGQRVEIKNINSIRFLRRAIVFEAERQMELLKKGEKVEQQTRGFDEVSGTTFLQRTKEQAQDYRYLPDPDLPPVRLTEADIAAIARQLPALPDTLVKHYTENLGLSAYEADLLVELPAMARYFNDLIACTPNAKTAANWLLNTVKGSLNQLGQAIEQLSVSPARLAELIDLVETGVISHTAATQRLWPAALQSDPTVSMADLAAQLQLLVESDDSLLDQWVSSVLQQHPDKVKAYRQGKKGLLGLFMGEVMRLANGKANPQRTQQLLLDRLK